MVSATGAPVHRCVHCSREFNRSEHLVRHERTHTKEKPYRCALCPQAFSRRDLLRRHELKTHQHRRQSSRAASNIVLQQQAHHSPRDFPHIGDSPAGENSGTSNTNDDASPSVPVAAENTIEVAGNTASHLQTAAIGPALWALNGQQQPSSIDIPMELDFMNSSRIQDYLLPDTMHWLETLNRADGHNLNPADSGLVDLTMVSQQGEAPAQVSTPSGQRQSFFSLPASPTLQPQAITTGSKVPTPAEDGQAMTEAYWNHMRIEVGKLNPSFVLPSRDILCQFIHRFFKSFHRHQPLLHEPTWSPNETPAWLVLAVCANGALYSLERPIAVEMHKLATGMIPPSESGLHALQAMMMLSAFSAWNGEAEDFDTALMFHSRMTSALRRSWACVNDDDIWSRGTPDWGLWRRRESLKRATYCIFTLMTLLTIAYDVASSVILERQHGLPAHEDQWNAASQDEWIQATCPLEPQEWDSAEAIAERLSNPSMPVPSDVGTFGAHVVMSLLLHKIIQFRKSCSFGDPGHAEMRQHFMMVLKRWQAMWEQEPGSSLSPDHPHEPMLFNCTAILRVAYIRLVSDYSDVRRCFGVCSEEQIARRVEVMPLPIRGPETTKAVLQTCLALRIPTQLGFKVIARTNFWVWSVQHAISYFEAALLLSKWLQGAASAEDLTADERGVMRLIHEILGTAGGGEFLTKEQSRTCSLPVVTLLRWAELLDTETTTVWRIIPKMARVLRIYAQMLSSPQESVR